MGYSHMFFGVDLDRLKSIYGSGDEAFIAEVLQAQAGELESNDGFFAIEIEDGSWPNSETALREIVAGSPGGYEQAEAMYGYVLKILCQHIGTSIGDDVAAIRDHPYESQLVASGPPLPIPYNSADFPEIGFLSLADIPNEIQRIDSAPKRAKRSLLLTILSLLSRGMIGRQMDAEETVEDMNAYRSTLTEAVNKGVSVVSFRH